MKLSLMLSLIILSVVGTVSAVDKETIGPEITKKTLELPQFHSIYVNSNYTADQ